MGAKYTTKLTCNTTQHDNALKKSASEVYKYNKSIDSAKSMLTKFGKKIPQIAAAVGVTTGAMATFKKMIEQTQSATDSWGRFTEQVNGALNVMANRMSGIGFGDFISNLKMSAKAAKDVYNELDKLGTMTIFNDKETADFNLKKAQYERIIKDKNSTSQQVREAQAGLKTLMEEYVKSQNALAEQGIKTYKAKMKQYFANNGVSVTDGFIEKYFGSLKGYESAAEDYNRLVEKMNRNRTWVDIYDFNTGQKSGGYWQDDNTAEDKRLRTALETVLQTSDKDLQEANGHYINARNIQTKLIQEETQQMLMNNKANTRIDKVETPKEEKVEEPKTALEKLQEELKKLEREKEFLIVEDGTILDENMWEDLNKKIKDTSDAIETLKYRLNPDKEFNLPVGQFSTYEDYDNVMKEVAFAEKYVADANKTIYGSIKDVTNAMESLIGVFEQWENISKGDADFADYFRAITSSIFTTIDAITSIIQAINLISTTATAVKTAQALIDASVAKANLAEMAAKVVAFYADLGPLGIAPASATIAAYKAMASISAFAGGGIVEGSSYIGDNNLARVNAGEMILNGTQQARLFKMLNGVGITNNHNMNDVVFHISGSDLVGTINNYTNKKGRVF